MKEKRKGNERKEKEKKMKEKRKKENVELLSKYYFSMRKKSNLINETSRIKLSLVLSI